MRDLGSHINFTNNQAIKQTENLCISQDGAFLLGATSVTNAHSKRRNCFVCLFVFGNQPENKSLGELLNIDVEGDSLD